MKIDPERVSPLLSHYLAAGYRQDQVVLDGIEIALPEGEICALASLTSWYESASGYHFTAPIAFVAIAQLAVIFAHVEMGMTAKTAEVYVREIQLKFRREIRVRENIPIRLVLSSSRVLENGKLYRGAIDVGGGSFVGNGSFYLPIEK